MDFKKTNNDLLRVNWPEGSKERVLIRDYPGCKSIHDAVKRVQNSSEPKAEIPPVPVPKPKQPRDSYEVMRDAIYEIEKALNGRDISKGNQVVREELGKMPLTTPDEILKWRDAWLKVIKPST